MSLETQNTVLFNHSISSWKDRCYVWVQLVRNDVQILHCIQGLLYHNQGFQRRSRERPLKHNTTTTSLCMTCCTLREQLFAWKTAYADMMFPGSAQAQLAMMLDQQRHMSGLSAVQSYIQQCQLNNVLRYISTWPYNVLGYQLSHCLAQVLLHQQDNL